MNNAVIDTTASPGFAELDSAPAPLRYKPSRFNVRAQAPDGSLILYNTYSGHCCIVPERGVQSVLRYLSQRGTEGALDSLGQYLLKNGHLIDANLDEHRMWDVFYGRQHYRPDMLNLVLFPSEDCNFRCVYCAQPFRQGVMEPHVRAAICKYVESKAPKLTLLGVDWFGGEPLLGYEVIAELAPFFQQIAARHEINYNTRITTNAYLLTPERARAMIGWGLHSFQITVDGLAKDHNRSRPLVDGGPTFERIMDNLTAMHEISEPFEVRLRVNVSQDNADTLDGYFEMVNGRLGHDPRFKIAFNVVGRWGSANDDQLHLVDKDTVGCRIGLRQRAQGAGLPIEYSMETIRGSMRCFSTTVGGMIVGVDGRLLKCTNHGAFPEALNHIGRLLDDGTLEISESVNLRWIAPYYQYDQRCRNCFYLPACEGGLICPARRVRGMEPECPEEKKHIRSVLLQYWRERTAAGGNSTVRLSMVQSPQLA